VIKCLQIVYIQVYCHMTDSGVFRLWGKRWTYKGGLGRKFPTMFQWQSYITVTVVMEVTSAAVSL